MNKVKKVLTSFSLFFVGMMSKVFAFGMEQTKYGVLDSGIVETKYGVFVPTIGEKISGVGKVAIPIILFIIGLFVIVSKKITKKIKIIVISGLIALGVIMWYIMNLSLIHI